MKRPSSFWSGVVIPLTIAAAWGGPQVAHAQATDRWAVHVRGGMLVPISTLPLTQEPGTIRLSTSPLFGLTVERTVGTRWGLRAGLDAAPLARPVPRIAPDCEPTWESGGCDLERSPAGPLYLGHLGAVARVGDFRGFVGLGPRIFVFPSGGVCQMTCPRYGDHQQPKRTTSVYGSVGTEQSVFGIASIVEVGNAISRRAGRLQHELSATMSLSLRER